MWSCSVEAENAAVFREEGKNSVSVDAKAKLIFETDDGGVYSLSKNIPVEMEVGTDTPLKAVAYGVSGTAYHIIGSEDIEVQFTAEATCAASRESEITQISAITVGAALEYIGRRPALTLCSAVEGESLWDLAKRLRTSASDIKTANDLTGDYPPYGKLLRSRADIEREVRDYGGHYKDISVRTNGNIYIGVIGPSEQSKSTLSRDLWKPW